VSVTADANVLVYASDSSCARQPVAAAKLRELSAGPQLLYLFWPVLLGYVRIATHAGIFAQPLSVSEAQTNVERLIERPTVICAGEADGFWQVYRQVTTNVPARGNVVPDAHLVALMRQYDVGTIWTHDRGFRRFDGIRVRDPFPDAGR
jgi:toxin-antitoxin system PIN domain toxin